MKYVLYVLAFLAYWTFGVIVCATVDRIVSKGHDPIDTRKDADMWGLSVVALFWPVILVFLIAFLFRETARWLVGKIQNVR